MPINEAKYHSVDAAASALADHINTAIKEGLARRGRASLAVSGGRTPKLVFKHLCQADLDWSKVTITLTDERWVLPEHPDSNEQLVRSHLLQGKAKSATFVPLYGGEQSPFEGQAACEQRLKEVLLPFDATYLGMGPDGHFASLFPHDPAMKVLGQLCVAVEGQGPRCPRMSLTAPTILNSRRIYLLFNGDEKLATYNRAKQPGSSEELPLRLVLLQEKTPVYVLRAP